MPPGKGTRTGSEGNGRNRQWYPKYAEGNEELPDHYDQTKQETGRDVSVAVSVGCNSP